MVGTHQEHRPFLCVFDSQAQMDLFDMSTYMQDNTRFRYVMVLIDIFSKFVFVRPLKTKEPVEIAWVLQNVFFENDPPLILQSDNGTN